jgi:WD40 repeat protein
LLDVNTDRLTDTRRLSFKVTSTGQRDGRPLLFDTKGGMHLFIDIDNLTTEKVPVAGNITAFASSKDDGLAAYGTADGTIYVTDGNGNVIKLVGHLSQVTRMRFDGPRLYSSSYDSKLLFWIIGDGKAKPITLFQSNSWLTDFTFDNQKDNIWTGEANGTLTEYLISLPLIRQRIRKNLKRNFTEQEWDYYVGKGIPYREVKN